MSALKKTKQIKLDPDKPACLKHVAIAYGVPYCRMRKWRKENPDFPVKDNLTTVSEVRRWFSSKLVKPAGVVALEPADAIPA